MNIVIIERRTFEVLARFEHIRQAVAVLPALSHAVGGAVFLYCDGAEELGLATADLPRSARFEFGYSSLNDTDGNYGIICPK